MGRILITGGTVITADEEGRVFAPGDVAVDGEVIVYVGPPLAREGAVEDAGAAGPASGTLPAGWRPERIIAAQGRLVLPGLINAHTHAAMTLLRGYAEDLPLMVWLQEKIFPAEARLTEEDIYWGTLLAQLEMIRSGTTAFADMYFGMAMVARAVEESGLRASLARGLIGISSEGERALEEAVSLVRSWHGAAGGRIRCLLGPHAPYTCPPAYLKKVMAEASKLGVGLHIHLAETREECEESRKSTGKSQIENLEELGFFELPVLAAHCVHLEPGDREILARRGVAVAHNPTSNLKLGNGIAPVAELLEAGVTVALGTDGAASNNDLDLFEELRLAALLQKGRTGDPAALPAAQAVSLATRMGAQALGLAGVVGELAPGRQADLILVRADSPRLTPVHDPLAAVVYAAHGDDVELTMVAGRVLYEGGRFLTLDEERIRREVERRAARLRGLEGPAR
ncbi:MAG: amidohydrolase [Bacillota bacterium]|nr:amidohydrolase [Bacillota bacterium]